MQQALYDFLFLGHLPGTNIDLSFWQIIGLLILGAILMGLRRYRYGWSIKIRARTRYYWQLSILEFRLLLLRLRLTQ